eukprot:3007786-Prymnesium_polylepis.1
MIRTDRPTPGGLASCPPRCGRNGALRAARRSPPGGVARTIRPTVRPTGKCQQGRHGGRQQERHRAARGVRLQPGSRGSVAGTIRPDANGDGCSQHDWYREAAAAEEEEKDPG